ncbi:MAG: peptidyl-prolyl cis-trans isomerase [Pseudobdellovibrio sp.]|nr:peptidyl-prolyl cis-trans isomerase [Pseudobdellovibrio sp.]
MQYHKQMSASDKQSLSLNARHILVPDRIAAEDVLRHLKSGKPFEELARKYSQCSSAPQGGDLGNLFGKKNVDSDFLEALELLKVGQISGVVRTRFGYHIIQRY